MPEEITDAAAQADQKLYIAPTDLLRGEPALPSSKYYTLRYVLAATLAEGESVVSSPAINDDSEALFRACRALGAELTWDDEQQRSLRVRGVGRPHREGPLTLNVGNAGAVLRLLLGLGALLPEVTFVTDYPQSLGKRPNRELLEALTTLGATCEGTGSGRLSADYRARGCIAWWSRQSIGRAQFAVSQRPALSGTADRRAVAN